MRLTVVLLLVLVSRNAFSITEYDSKVTIQPLSDYLRLQKQLGVANIEVEEIDVTTEVKFTRVALVYDYPFNGKYTIATIVPLRLEELTKKGSEWFTERIIMSDHYYLEMKIYRTYQTKSPKRIRRMKRTREKIRSIVK